MILLVILFQLDRNQIHNIHRSYHHSHSELRIFFHRNECERLMHLILLLRMTMFPTLFFQLDCCIYMDKCTLIILNVSKVTILTFLCDMQCYIKFISFCTRMFHPCPPSHRLSYFQSNYYNRGYIGQYLILICSYHLQHLCYFARAHQKPSK